VTTSSLADFQQKNCRVVQQLKGVGERKHLLSSPENLATGLFLMLRALSLFYEKSNRGPTKDLDLDAR